MPEKLKRPFLHSPAASTSPASDGRTPDSPKAAAAAPKPSSPVQAGRKRRTASGHASGAGAGGGRGVASLTPEQLAKKRANDREAQRAIRERTRNEIEGLKSRIRELTERQPYRELEQALRAKERAEAENDEIKRRLAGVLSLIQPLLGSDANGVVADALAGPVASPPSMPSAHDRARQKSASPASGYNSGQTSLTTLAAASSGTSPNLHGGAYAATGPYTPTMASTPGTAESHRAGGVPSPSVSCLSVPSERFGSDYAPPHSATERVALGYMAEPAAEPQLTHHHHHQTHRHHPVGRPPALHSTALPADSHIIMGTPSPRSATGGGPPRPSAAPPYPHYHALHPPLVYSPPPHLPFSSYGPHQPSGPPGPVSTPLPHIPLTVSIPPHVPATCPLDGLLLEYLAKRRRLAASAGVPGSRVTRWQLIGPPRPAFETLLAPDLARRAHVPCHASSRLLADVIDRFPDIERPPERAAVLYIMYLILRFQTAAVAGPALAESAQARVNGDAATPNPMPAEVACDGAHEGPEEDDGPADPHEDLPAWCRPTALQAATPHPIWVDSVPWPRMRDVLMRDPAAYPLENYFIPYCQGLGLNWPYGDAAIWAEVPRRDHRKRARDGDRRSDEAERPEDPPQMTLNPAFEAHARDLGNWSLGPAFAHTFPELVDDVRIETPRMI